MHVLVVDDDDVIRSLWTTVLERAGYQVSSASDGQEALDYLRQNQPLPDLILLDLMMPTMNGWQFLKELREEPLFASLVVVVISANDIPGKQLASFGIAAYLQKPVAMKTLLETVAQFSV